MGQPESIEITYVDAKDCRTSPSTGVVLSGPVGDTTVWQLAFYADISKGQPEKYERSGGPKYERVGEQQSIPCREVQARIMIPEQILVALAALIERSLEKAVEMRKSSNEQP